MSRVRMLVAALVLVWVLGACGGELEIPPTPTAAPVTTAAPLPTAIVTLAPVETEPVPTAAATMTSFAGGTDPVTEPVYRRVELGEGGLSLEIPASWEQLAPEWVWTPGGQGAVRVGVRWADLTPPMEAEAALLPGNSQVLGSQARELDWGQGRLIDLEVYAEPVQGEGRAPLLSVERHVLVVMPGDVRRAYDLYAAAPTAEALAPGLPVLDQMVASARPTTVEPSPAVATEPAQGESRTVEVFFDNAALNPNAQDCGAVFAIERQVPAAANRLDAALNELFAGPTASEQAKGYTSWFSLDTANLLVDAFVEGDRAYVNLGDLRPLIPSAGSSCGSVQLLAQMDHTVRAAAPGVTRVLYAIEGSPQPFWEWLQIGCGEANDYCDPRPFGGE